MISTHRVESLKSALRPKLRYCKTRQEDKGKRSHSYPFPLLHDQDRSALQSAAPEFAITAQQHIHSLYRRKQGLSSRITMMKSATLSLSSLQTGPCSMRAPSVSHSCNRFSRMINSAKLSNGGLEISQASEITTAVQSRRSLFSHSALLTLGTGIVRCA